MTPAGEPCRLLILAWRAFCQGASVDRSTGPSAARRSSLVQGGALQRHSVCSYGDHLPAMPACAHCKAGFRRAAQAFAGEAQAASRNMQCGQRDLYACPILNYDRGQDCLVVEDGRRQDSEGRVRRRCRV